MKKIIALVGVSLLAWYSPTYLENEANRLEQEGTGFERPLIPDRIVNGVPEVDDFPMPSVKGVPNRAGPNKPNELAPVEQEDKTKLRQAKFYRESIPIVKHWWWGVPAVTFLLMLLSSIRGGPTETREIKSEVCEKEQAKNPSAEQQ